MSANRRIIAVTIPRAIILLVVLTLGLGIIDMYNMNSTINTYQTVLDEEVEMAQDADQLNILLLQARRAEKDFMFRGELEKQALANSYIRNMTDAIAFIKETTHRQDTKDLLDTFDTDRTTYETLFNKVAQNLINRGGGIFGKDNGIVGNFRTSVHNIESTLGTLHNESVLLDVEYFELNTIMLEVRRAEKDYLLRVNTDASVADKIAAIPVLIDEFTGILDTTAVNDTMISFFMTNWIGYQNNFDALVTMDEEIATDTFNFRYAVHQMELRLDEIREEIEEETKIAISNAEAAIVQARVIGTILMVGIVLMASVVGIYLVRKITNPIDTLSAEFKLLREGDLTADLKFERAPTEEIQSLGDSYNVMKGTLKELIMGISNSNETVTHTSEELVSSAEEVNASAEEVASTSQAMSHGATTQTELINEVSEEIKQTTKLVDEIIGSIRNNTNQVSQIALQTNILALNAGIEASRAGDYGRGFAVVAENIRKLSDESKHASESITIIADEIAARLEDAFNKIGSTMLNVVSISEETSASAEEVAAAAEEVTSSMEELSSAAQVLTEQVMVSSTQIANFRMK